jgi:hypothetical protein
MVELDKTFSLMPRWIILMICMGEYSIANLVGHEPAHRPHCIQSSMFSPPCIFVTSLTNEFLSRLDVNDATSFILPL